MSSITTAERFGMLAMVEDSTDRVLESGERAALEAHTPSDDEPPIEFEGPDEPYNSEYDGLIVALAEVMGPDAESFKQFCDAMYSEKHIGMFRSALKDDGMARKDIRKALNTWLKSNTPDQETIPGM